MPHTEAHSDSHLDRPDPITYIVDIGKGRIRLPIDALLAPEQAKELALYRVRQWFRELDPTKIKNARVDSSKRNRDYVDPEMPFLENDTYMDFKGGVISRSGLGAGWDDDTDMGGFEGNGGNGGNNGNNGFFEEISDSMGPNLDPEVLLDEALGSVTQRQSFFNQEAVDPALEFGGNRFLRQQLQRGFDPVNAAFQARNILRDDDEQVGFRDSPQFQSGNVPTTGSIRDLLRQIALRQRLGEGTGGLSGTGTELLREEDVLNRLMSQASGSRDVAASSRSAFNRAFSRRLQKAQFADPGSNDLLRNFVNSGFTGFGG